MSRDRGPQPEEIWRWGLDRVYPVPDPLRSHEDWRRHAHQDLGQMARSELQLELSRLRQRFLLDRPPYHPWLVERHRVLLGVLRERR